MFLQGFRRVLRTALTKISYLFWPFLSIICDKNFRVCNSSSLASHALADMMMNWNWVFAALMSGWFCYHRVHKFENRHRPSLIRDQANKTWAQSCFYMFINLNYCQHQIVLCLVAKMNWLIFGECLSARPSGLGRAPSCITARESDGPDVLIQGEHG
jgi:hypothetical protein